MTDILFVKTFRDCPYNHKRREAGARTGFIYDYEIHDNGQHVATFSKWGSDCRKYALVDLSGERIPSECYHITFAYTKADFLPEYVAAKTAGRIPTIDQIAERQAGKLAKLREDHETAVIRHHAPAIFKLFEDITANARRAGVESQTVRDSEALIEQVRAAMADFDPKGRA